MAKAARAGSSIPGGGHSESQNLPAHCVCITVKESQNQEAHKLLVHLPLEITHYSNFLQEREGRHHQVINLEGKKCRQDGEGERSTTPNPPGGSLPLGRHSLSFQRFAIEMCLCSERLDHAEMNYSWRIFFQHREFSSHLTPQGKPQTEAGGTKTERAWDLEKLNQSGSCSHLASPGPPCQEQNNILMTKRRKKSGLGRDNH